MRATDTGDLRPLIALLKALWRLRAPDGTEPTGARLVRRWREKRLLAQLEREWSGGFALHRNGDLVYVPHPLDTCGRHALLNPIWSRSMSKATSGRCSTAPARLSRFFPPARLGNRA